MGADATGWTGSDPRDAEFGKKLPALILRKGWQEVVLFLRKLLLGAKGNHDIKIDVVGAGCTGKTSLIRALKSDQGKTARIDLDNRTIGVELDEIQLGSVRVKTWDMAGQEVYRGLQAPFITQRCVAILAYKPEETNLEEVVLGWLRLIASKSPAARIVVVSTHSKSGTKAVSVDQRAKLVEELVQSELQKANAEVKKEASTLQKNLLQIREEMQHAATDKREELEKERRAVEERLRLLTESEEGRRVEKQMSLLSGRVWCVDSVVGDGISELREALIKDLEELPFVGELVPARWVRLKETVDLKYAQIVAQAKDCSHVLSTDKYLVRRDVVISWLGLEREEWGGMDEEEAWEAVEFYSLLAEWKVHKDSVLLDPRLLLELNKSLAFHCPGKALERKTSSRGEECDDMFVPGFEQLSDDDKNMVRTWSKALEEEAKLHEGLLSKLYKWKEMSAEERKGLMEVMEEMDFVSYIEGCDGEKTWVALLRLEWTFGIRSGEQDTSSAGAPENSERNEGSPGAVYKLHFVPPGFYSQVVASVLRLRGRFKTWSEERRESRAMRVRFQMEGGREHFLVVGVTEDGLEVRSSSMAMIQRVCVPAEKLLGTQFPGISFTVRVHNMSQEHDRELEDLEGVKLDDEQVAKHIFSVAKIEKPRKPEYFAAAGLRAALAAELAEHDGRVGGEISFAGRVVPRAQWCIASFPGIHSYVWQKLTKNERISSNCVFFPIDKKNYGEHFDLHDKKLQDLLAVLYPYERAEAEQRIDRLTVAVNANLPCYCMTLYPDILRKRRRRPEWGCWWFECWRVGLHEALDDGQRAIVVYQDVYDPRSTFDLLGNSQRGEVEYAAKVLKNRGGEIQYASVNELRPLL